MTDSRALSFEIKKHKIKQAHALFKKKMHSYSPEKIATSPDVFDRSILSLNYRYDPEFKILENMSDLSHCISFKYVEHLYFLKSREFIRKYGQSSDATLSIFIKYNDVYIKNACKNISGKYFESFEIGTFYSHEIKSFVAHKLEEYFITQGFNVINKDSNHQKKKIKILFKQYS